MTGVRAEEGVFSFVVSQVFDWRAKTAAVEMAAHSVSFDAEAHLMGELE